MMMMMKTTFQLYIALLVVLSLASVQSHQIPTLNAGSSVGGIIDAHFGTDLFSALLSRGEKFEFKSLFDFDDSSEQTWDGTETILFRSTNDNDDDAVGGTSSRSSNSTLFDNNEDDYSTSRIFVLRDHNTVDQLVGSNSLPCRFYTRDGEKIDDLKQLKSIFVGNSRTSTESSLSQSSLVSSNSCMLHGNTACSDSVVAEQQDIEELHLYATPNGRLFIYAPSFYAKCDKSYYS